VLPRGHFDVAQDGADVDGLTEIFAEIFAELLHDLILNRRWTRMHADEEIRSQFQPRNKGKCRATGFSCSGEALADMMTTAQPAMLLQNRQKTMNSVIELKKAMWIGLILVLGTLALYWPVTQHSFLDFDDDVYVTENPMVMRGLTPAGVRWAFTTDYAANWHPLTWISHMLDVSMSEIRRRISARKSGAAFGECPLLFIVLIRMTRALWPSALVAALFAWHPLHVESVAWVAERKDVLSTFFGLLTLYAYGRYAAGQNIESRTSNTEHRTKERKFYLWVGADFFHLVPHEQADAGDVAICVVATGLWPIGRRAKGEVGNEKVEAAPPSTINSQPSTLRQLVIEKLPFFALSAAACVVTVIVQKAGGAIRTLEHVPLVLRAFNAPAAYLRYIGYTLWPENSASFTRCQQSRPWRWGPFPWWCCSS